MQTEKVEETAVSRYAWVILIIVFLASVAAPLSQNKVPPLMPILMQSFNIGLSQAGLLMSVFSITGFLLALPAGIILQKLGSRTSGVIAVSSLVLGAGLGALSGSMGLLLTSRVIEGVGMGLIAVVGPAVLALWFPPEKQGMPMGIWATWVPVGSIIMMITAPQLGLTAGWQSVWWLSAGFALVALLLYALLMRTPPSATDHERETTPLPLRQVLADRNIWLLGLTFCLFNVVFMPLVTYYPTFLVEVRGYSLTDASLIVSISTALVLISAPLAGWLSDKIGSRKLLFTMPFLAIAAIMMLPFKVVGWQIIVLMAVQGLIVGAVPTATFAAVPEIMGKPQLAGLGMAVIMMGQNLGMFAAPIIFGMLVESIGWVSAGYWLVPVALIGFAIGRLVKVR
ncbi:MAG: MFS transporter [Ardenticatenaceae bacterium]|nr:MFS transporter [Ardenticatenaceae bacterium]MCB9443347.1 MFS transporter [Ardenticatenaceae bacterium]